VVKKCEIRDVVAKRKSFKIKGFTPFSIVWNIISQGKLTTSVDHSGDFSLDRFKVIVGANTMFISYYTTELKHRAYVGFVDADI